jgi:hypothetical protein
MKIVSFRLKVRSFFHILLRPAARRVRLLADQVDIVSCDSRKYPERPQKYGVTVYQRVRWGRLSIGLVGCAEPAVQIRARRTLLVLHAVIVIHPRARSLQSRPGWTPRVGSQFRENQLHWGIGREAGRPFPSPLRPTPRAS